MLSTQLDIRAGRWKPVFGGLLTNKVFGIVGCGFIGKDLVTLLQPFGCKILVYDIKYYSDFYISHGVVPVPLDQLLRESDIISIHVPYTKQTHLMLNVENMNLMKREALLINAARGKIVDETQLKHMLKNNKLAGAAFDVFGEEPCTDQELLNLPNFQATPHIGGSTIEAALAMGRAAIRGLDDNRAPHV
jgi:D-3-phosphoglycerate dehydrogenase